MAAVIPHVFFNTEVAGSKSQLYFYLQNQFLVSCVRGCRNDLRYLCHTDEENAANGFPPPNFRVVIPHNIPFPADREDQEHWFRLSTISAGIVTHNSDILKDQNNLHTSIVSGCMVRTSFMEK